MSFPLQNAEPSVAFKRGQFDFRQVLQGLSSSRMVRLDGRGALLSHPLSAGKEEGLRLFSSYGFCHQHLRFTGQARYLRTFTKRENAGEGWRRLGQ
jgi:hypothetical protein